LLLASLLKKSMIFSWFYLHTLLLTFHHQPEIKFLLSCHLSKTHQRSTNKDVHMWTMLLKLQFNNASIYTCEQTFSCLGCYFESIQTWTNFEIFCEWDIISICAISRFQHILLLYLNFDVFLYIVLVFTYFCVKMLGLNSCFLYRWIIILIRTCYNIQNIFILCFVCVMIIIVVNVDIGIDNNFHNFVT
jgi:hypothetical protein